jgi:hypothetical protein
MRFVDVAFFAFENFGCPSLSRYGIRKKFAGLSFIMCAQIAKNCRGVKTTSAFSA